MEIYIEDPDLGTLVHYQGLGDQIRKGQCVFLHCDYEVLVLPNGSSTWTHEHEEASG